MFLLFSLFFSFFCWKNAMSLNLSGSLWKLYPEEIRLRKKAMCGYEMRPKMLFSLVCTFERRRTIQRNKHRANKKPWDKNDAEAKQSAKKNRGPTKMKQNTHKKSVESSMPVRWGKTIKQNCHHFHKTLRCVQLILWGTRSTVSQRYDKRNDGFSRRTLFVHLITINVEPFFEFLN